MPGDVGGGSFEIDSLVEASEAEQHGRLGVEEGGVVRYLRERCPDRLFGFAQAGGGARGIDGDGPGEVVERERERRAAERIAPRPRAGEEIAIRRRRQLVRPGNRTRGEG